jgi:hypothetical protein
MIRVFNPLTPPFDAIGDPTIPQYTVDPSVVTEGGIIINITDDGVKVGFLGVWQTIATLTDYRMKFEDGTLILTEDDIQMTIEN